MLGSPIEESPTRASNIDWNFVLYNSLDRFRENFGALRFDRVVSELRDGKKLLCRLSVLMGGLLEKGLVVLYELNWGFDIREQLLVRLQTLIR